MDRTIIDTYRQEEKVLSEQIHKKLETLMLIHHPSSEFKKLFVEGLFLKPNQKAFFYVMHFLLTFFDLNEFKKRFYWPIADRKSEGIFRTGIVEYMTYLNKKYNLQWKHQWNYLVQMPGGIKFLTFLIDLTDFTTREIVKQKEKYFDDKNYKVDEPFGKSLLTKLKLRHKCFKINSLHYVESLDSITKKYKENSEVIRNKVGEIAQKHGICLANLLNEGLVNEFCEFSKETLKDKISCRMKHFALNEENIKIIRRSVEDFESQKNKFKYETEKLEETAKIFFPHEQIISNNEINFWVLSNVFINICPIVDNLLTIYNENSLSVLNFEESALTKLNVEVLKLDTDVKKFLSALNYEYEIIRKNEKIYASNKNDTFCKSNLLPKLLYTPPITNFNCTQVQFRHCLPLMHNDSSATLDDFTFANNQTTIMFPQSGHKLKNDFKNKRENQTNCKILDPSAFLKSLKKTSKKRIMLKNEEQNSNLTELARKWKEQEESICKEENSKRAKAQQMKVYQKEDKIESDVKISFTINKAIKMVDSPIFAEKPEFSKRKLFLDFPQEFNKIIKESPNFLKQGSPLEMNLKRMSTSPSGRLDSLIQFDKNSFTKNMLSNLEILELNDSSTITEVLDIATVLDVSEIKDSLFNVSDSILKDLPM